MQMVRNGCQERDHLRTPAEWNLSSVLVYSSGDFPYNTRSERRGAAAAAAVGGYGQNKFPLIQLKRMPRPDCTTERNAV